MSATAIFVWEPWPLTSFRLFSHVRADEQSAWVARTVDARGEEAAYPLGSLPRGFQGFSFTMAEFRQASSLRQDELCRTWVGAAPQLVGVDARAVRIYERRWRLSARENDRALSGREELIYECSGTGLVR